MITHLKSGGMKLDGLCNIRKEKDGKREILKLAFSEVVYGTWIYRNRVVFENDSVNMSIAKSIIDTIVHRGWHYAKYRAHIAIMLI